MKKFYIDWTLVSFMSAITALILTIGVIAVFHYRNENTWKQDCAARGGFIVEAHDNGIVCIDENRKMIK